MYENELAAMKRAAREAGAIILGIYNQTDVGIEFKKDSSPVTEADRLADEFIIRSLGSQFPGIPLLTEESADTPARLNSEFCFIVDPLDGTKEFIKRNGEFTVNIALCRQSRIVAGAIYLPVSDQLYYASSGSGSFLDEGKKTTQLHASQRRENPRLAVSRSHRTEEENLLIEQLGITEVIEAGSSLKGCLVAKGDAEMYYRYGNTMEWDVAAMQIIVEEAGGTMRHIDGNDIIYNKKDPVNRSFYAKNF
jgi:3'(2'), 5'-bisphosphate nucleotidase